MSKKKKKQNRNKKGARRVAQVNGATKRVEKGPEKAGKAPEKREDEKKPVEAVEVRSDEVVLLPEEVKDATREEDLQNSEPDEVKNESSDVQTDEAPGEVVLETTAVSDILNNRDEELSTEIIEEPESRPEAIGAPASVALYDNEGLDKEIPEVKGGKKRRHYRALVWWAVGICSLAVLIVGGFAVAKLFEGNTETGDEGAGEMIVEEVPESAPEEPAEEEPKEEEPEPEKEPEAVAPPVDAMPEIAPRPEPVKDYPEVVGGHKVVALTFDDGPSTATTPRLLDILKGRGVKATFFVLGSMARQAPEILRREAAEGHEVASHTPYHNQQTLLSATQVRAEALEMDRIFTDILGTVPRFTRPPYGSYNQTVQNAIGQPLIIWSVDPRDWQYRDASTVCTNVVSGTFDGSVILVHDIHASTVDAVPCIIDTLRAQGYEFLTVSELAAYRDVPLVNGGVYGKF